MAEAVSNHAAAGNLIARERAPFSDPQVTADGSPRAQVPFRGYEVLWFNTGTQCNLACANCYIESSPHNDALQYLAAADVAAILDQLPAGGAADCEIGFTGGEPFMNPGFVAMLADTLARGHRVLVLTNAMQPMQRHRAALLDLHRRFGARLTLRVSLDHPDRARFGEERGRHAWTPTLRGLRWLVDNGFAVQVAARSQWGDAPDAMRAQFRALFARERIAGRALEGLVIFPEMQRQPVVPEITTACWGILGKRPDDLMCANARMVVHRRGEPAVRVVACTLLPHDPRFDLGASLAEAARTVALNHRWCAQFCVLGGGSCSG